MIIDPASPDHPYVQLAAWFRVEIKAARIGAKLPTVEALSDLSGLSPATVQRALRILKEEGVIYGVAGRGLFVSSS